MPLTMNRCPLSRILFPETVKLLCPVAVAPAGGAENAKNSVPIKTTADNPSNNLYRDVFSMIKTCVSYLIRTEGSGVENRGFPADGVLSVRISDRDMLRTQAQKTSASFPNETLGCPCPFRVPYVHLQFFFQNQTASCPFPILYESYGFV